MTVMPTKAELDSRIASVTRALRVLDKGAAKLHCIGEATWAKGNWTAAVAAGYISILRDVYRKRFRA